MQNTLSLPAVVQSLLNVKGQNVRLRTIRNLKVRKGCAPILKDAIVNCRVGINYDNMDVVREGREDGSLPEENPGLSWGEWLQFPYVITHTPKGSDTARLYFRVYPSSDRNAGALSVVRYFRNGAEITREAAQIDAYASEFDDERPPLKCWTVKIDDIAAVNGVPVQ